jgi:hypothetical protein
MASNTELSSAASVSVVDLRGAQAPLAVPPVLLDLSGRRARHLRATGRVVGTLFLAWLAALVLAGLGLLPLSDITFGALTRSSQEPAGLNHRPAPRMPTSADLRPARPLAIGRSAASSQLVRQGPTAGGSTPIHDSARRSTAPISTTPANSPGRSGTAPGQQSLPTTSPGRSGTAPGQQSRPTTTSSPGPTTTTSSGTITSPGRSGSAPGRSNQPLSGTSKG